MEKMESVDEEREIQLKRIEEVLLQNGNWAIRASQVIGYFPFRVDTKNGLRWKLCSFPVFFSVLVFITGLVWLYPYHYILATMETILMLQSPTERFANALLSYAHQAFSQVFRIRHMLTAKQFVAFWKTNLNTIAQLSNTKYLNFLDSEELACFRQKFDRIGVTTRNTVLVLWALSLIQLGATAMLLPNDPLLKATILFWCYTIYFHPGYSVWAAYFPRIYTVGFSVIRYQLDRVSCREEKLNGPRESVIHTFGGFDALKQELSTPDKELRKRDADVFAAIVIPQMHQPQIMAKFQTGGGDPLRIQVLSLKKQLETNDEEIEEVVNCCIDSYYILDAQVKSYGAIFGRYLMFNILVEIVVILTYSFFMFMWGHKGYFIGILGAMIPLFLYSAELFTLATVADSLQVEAHKIVNLLNFLPFENLSTDVQSKVQLLAIKISAAPPKIEPCSYFTLNRNLITSILSALTMYLIVLVQFENADIDFKPTQTEAPVGDTE